MANNRRIYYAAEALGIAPYTDTQNSPSTSTSFKDIRGLQSLGINTKFNLEQVFEIGQLAIYENIENIPDVEITLEKVLDGYAPIYLSATQGAGAATLVGRSNQRANVALNIYADTVSLASGTPMAQSTMSGVYVSQFSYDIMVQGDAKESVTLVGNNKVWSTGTFTFSGVHPSGGVSSLSPAAAEGVNRRQDFVMASSLFPLSIPGISSSGTNELDVTNGCFNVSFQSAKVSANLGREDLLELGRRGPYFRYVNFPVEVSTSMEIIAKIGDLVQATEVGIYSGGSNLNDERIKFVMQEGLILDMGSKNKLASVNYGGANAGSRGGNGTITFNYTTFNDLTVQHPLDPTTALRP